MAFTNAQRASIRRYLGWPDRFFQLDSRLEAAMGAVTAEGETLIIAELAAADAADTAIKAPGLKTHFKAEKVGSIVLQGADELELLRSQGRQAVGRISSMLGVEVRHDVFAGAAPAGNYLMHG